MIHARLLFGAFPKKSVKEILTYAFEPPVEEGAGLLVAPRHLSSDAFTTMFPVFINFSLVCPGEPR